MELEALLAAMDRAAANLDKLDAVWERARVLLPTGPARGSDPQYDDLARAWLDLLEGLPPIDGWTVTAPLPEPDVIGRWFVDLMDIGEPPFDAFEAAEAPGRDLADYRYRLARARRRAGRKRLVELCDTVEAAVRGVTAEVQPDSKEPVDPAVGTQVRAALDEIERLMGTASRTGRWSDLRRHLRFNQGLDWHDIHELDWPSVRTDIDAASLADSDPLPVPKIDLGIASTENLTGQATLALDWSQLTDEGFERLLYDLLRSYPEHENVQWLMHTKAPDRGRDLSLDRATHHATGSLRVERVIVQAKHWLSRSVGPADLANTMTSVSLWQPPLVRTLIVATSGRFTADAVAYAEAHNERGVAPTVELWSDSRLESLLAQRPAIAAAHGLR